MFINSEVQRARRKAQSIMDSFGISPSDLKAVFYVLQWWCLSTALTIYNKLMLGKDHGLLHKEAFPAPLFMAGVQFMFQHYMATLYIWFWTSGDPHSQQSQTHDSARAWQLLPTSIATGLDIGLSNWSLYFITISFYTMCRSTSPLWLLVFAYFFRLEQPNCNTVLVFSIIAGGLMLAVQGETQFSGKGFIMVMIASCLSGLRWVLTQLLLRPRDGAGGGGGDGHKGHDPAALVRDLTPGMSITVLVASCIIERPWDMLAQSFYFHSFGAGIMTFCMIAVGALLAFLMLMGEFQVILLTSAMTFQVAGCLKEVVTICVAVLVFQDVITPLNGVGLALVILGSMLYKMSRVSVPATPQFTLEKSPSGALTPRGTLTPVSGAGVSPLGTPLGTPRGGPSSSAHHYLSEGRTLRSEASGGTVELSVGLAIATAKKSND